MYDLAGIVGSTACRVMDGMMFSGCQTSDEMIVVGFTLITLAGVGALMIAVMRIDRLT